VRTRRWWKILLAAAALVAATAGFAAWYRQHYSMDVARSFDVNDPGATVRVLIATQGSEFKDALVAGVVAELGTRATYVRVIDISLLPRVNADDWNAIVLIHTWEMRNPPTAAKAFVARLRDTRKLVVLGTSGARRSWRRWTRSSAPRRPGADQGATAEMARDSL
jgi:hypothetical protein